MGSGADADGTGAVAQLGERRFCTPEVAGSIPVSSIYFYPANRLGSNDIPRSGNSDKYDRSLTIDSGIFFFVLTKLYGQVIKSTLGMPWCRKAIKDVASCEKLR
jgi:hypothetical protein